MDNRVTIVMLAFRFSGLPRRGVGTSAHWHQQRCRACQAKRPTRGRARYRLRPRARSPVRGVHLSHPGPSGRHPRRGPAPHLHRRDGRRLSYAQPQGDEGRILATLKITNDEEARCVARRILDLHRELDRLLR